MYVQRTQRVIPVVKRDATLETDWVDTGPPVGEAINGAQQACDGGANIKIWIETSGVANTPSLDVQLQVAVEDGGTWTNHPDAAGNFQITTATTTITASIAVISPYMRLVLDASGGSASYTITTDYAAMHLIP